MDLFNLFGKLTLDKDSYEQGLKSASKLTKDQARDIKRNFDEMSKNNVKSMKEVITQLEKGQISLDEYRRKVEELKQSQIDLDVATKEFGIKSGKSIGIAVTKWLAVAAAIATGTTAIFRQTKAVIDYSNRVGDLAKNYGFTNEQIQEFDYWATTNGTTIDEVLNSMKSLVTNTVSGADKFAKLGVALKDSSGATKSQRDLFLDTVDALNKVESQTERNAYILELFGDAGLNINQILGQSREELEALTEQGKELGVFISDDAIENATNFNMELAILGKQWQGLLSSIINGDEDVDAKMNIFIDSLGEKIGVLMPKIVTIGVTIIEGLIKGIIVGLPDMIRAITDALLDVDWFSIGWELIKSVIEGIWEGFKNSFLWSIGKGWLWDTRGSEKEIKTSQNELNTIVNNTKVERTEKVDETLDITLRVEGDGTDVSDKNLEVVSDLVVQKINKILGGEL